MIYMTNKIVAIQGDNLKKINIKTDTTIFLANEAQNKGYKLFYYCLLYTSDAADDC